MSSSIALRRSPNPGALTAATFKPPRSLLTTSVARASPSTSSATINNGFADLTADSSSGSSDCRLDSFFSCREIPLPALPLGRSGEGDDAADARIQRICNALDDPTLARCIPPLEDDAHLETVVPHTLLHLDQLDLEVHEFLDVVVILRGFARFGSVIQYCSSFAVSLANSITSPPEFWCLFFVFMSIVPFLSRWCAGWRAPKNEPARA